MPACPSPPPRHPYCLIDSYLLNVDCFYLSKTIVTKIFKSESKGKAMPSYSYHHLILSFKLGAVYASWPLN